MALERGRAVLPGFRLCDSLAVYMHFQVAISQALLPGSVAGGNVARAAEVRHGDSGGYNTRDGVARSGYVPTIGLARCLDK
jgi:hypothetical protein